MTEKEKIKFLIEKYEKIIDQLLDICACIGKTESILDQICIYTWKIMLLEERLDE